MRGVAASVQLGVTVHLKEGAWSGQMVKIAVMVKVVKVVKGIKVVKIFKIVKVV